MLIGDTPGTPDPRNHAEPAYQASPPKAIRGSNVPANRPVSSGGVARGSAPSEHAARLGRALDADLLAIRTSLLRGLRPRKPLGSSDGELAFERHILLAIRFHKAAGLNQTRKGEGVGWCEYFDEHFPKRPGWSVGDAKVLWDDWRVGLVKWETPKSRVTVTHGRPDAHWHREPDGTLCIDLESMWDDFTRSVDSFVGLLARDEQRRDEAVRRWNERRWIVRHLVVESPRFFNLMASAASSATAMAPPPPPPPDASR